jgi:predicted transposase YbfD/YdcC
LPNHSDDIRRLLEESIAAKESARVLTEALVFTRPEDLPSKPIIKVSRFAQVSVPSLIAEEFYRKCFMAHESLTNQMDWAQAEASRSRENINVQRLMTTDSEQDVRSQTMEEEALASLFEAHSALAEGIRQHDELERMAQDEYELKQVRERSRKDTRMDRNVCPTPQSRLTLN